MSLERRAKNENRSNAEYPPLTTRLAYSVLDSTASLRTLELVPIWCACMALLQMMDALSSHVKTIFMAIVYHPRLGFLVNVAKAYVSLRFSVYANGVFRSQGSNSILNYFPTTRRTMLGKPSYPLLDKRWTLSFCLYSAI